MTLRPCIQCGEPSEGTRCPEHQPPAQVKASARARGYSTTWDKLSKRARRLQPFCTDCGAIEDLQADHTPEAWKRKAQGLVIRLEDVAVVCGPCNRDRGAARGETTRGEGPPDDARDPSAKALSQLHMGTVLNSGRSVS